MNSVQLLYYSKIYKYSMALQCYNKALQINPDHYMLYINIGALYQSLRNSKKAIENYRGIKRKHKIIIGNYTGS